MSLTYAHMRRALSPLQTSCSFKHKLNGVFFEHYVPDIRSQEISLTSTEGKLLLEHKLDEVFFEHYVPDIRSQATSLTST
ncbi:unnamed protein product [Prunus armeniaca]